MILKHLFVFATFYDFTNIPLVSGDTYNASIIFYNGANGGESTYSLATAERVVQEATFDKEKITVIIIHGWRQSPAKPTIVTMTDAFTINGNFNILVLDWSQAAASINLLLVQSRVDELGTELALLLNRMNAQGVLYSKLHLIGHSLGANLASKSGHHSQSSKNFIGRITGLDPAISYPLPVSASDASFVDVMHTNQGEMGTFVDSGTAQFYPNNGGPTQPGCSDFDPPCSHLRAIDLFAESVKNNFSTNFIATNSGSATQVQMGINCPMTATGKYYLKTNGESLYSQT